MRRVTKKTFFSPVFIVVVVVVGVVDVVGFTVINFFSFRHQLELFFAKPTIINFCFESHFLRKSDSPNSSENQHKNGNCQLIYSYESWTVLKYKKMAQL